MIILTPITLTYTDDGWLLAETVQVRDPLASFEVPAGFVTDLASVPRILWPLIPPFGPYIGAAVVHDWLYVTQVISRARADAIFLSIMESDRVPAALRWIMYLAVRAGGWFPWRRNARARRR